jgi:hypothetical protein
MKKKWLKCATLIALLLLAAMVPVAGAFDNYSGGCDGCHGNFPGITPYISLRDGIPWRNPSNGVGYNLHDGHRTYMLGLSSTTCNICHTGTAKFPVFLNSSNGGVAGFPAIACTGCHDGDGLREHHVTSGAYSCYSISCHSQVTPQAENVVPPYYFTPDPAHPNKPTDPCNLNGTESRLSPTVGLDNDGNGLYDQNDPACSPATPIISVSPSTLSFGNQAVNTSSTPQMVTISNAGTAILSVTNITNSNTADFTLMSPLPPFSIAAGGSQTFATVFNPGNLGAKSAAISISSDGGNATVNATGTGVAPLLSVSPSALTFGSQTIGTTSSSQSVTISNTGTATLNVTGLTSSNAEFAFSPTTLSPIAPGGSTILSVTFTPTDPAGDKSGTIGILSNGGSATVSATGTGVAAGALSVSPLTLTYGNQTVGTASAAQTVTISNAGGTALTVSSIANSNTADFVLTAPVTPLTINGGASQTFTLAFSPSTSGGKSATISISSTAGSEVVSASGTGVAVVTQPVLSVSPSSLTFSNITISTTSTKTFTISNTGNAPLNIANIALTGSSAFSFSPASFTSIAAGSNVTLNVAYSPTVAGADPGATISITSDGGNAVVNLSGNAVQQSAGDVALVKLKLPKTIRAKVGRKYETGIEAEATTTLSETRATITLAAVYPASLNVIITPTSRTENLSAVGRRPKKFEFEGEIVCNEQGTWPVTWTATINSEKNSDPANDVLTGITQVTCSSRRR